MILPFSSFLGNIMSVDQIISAESGGDPNARNPRSSATGAGQFIDATWLAMMADRPDLTANLSRDQILALRNNPDISREMTAKYAEQNNARLQAAGYPVTAGNTYLAHFAGPQGALGVLGADPSTPAIQVLDPDGKRGILKANPFLAKMTAGDLAAWANRKMGAPQAAPPQVPSQPPSTGPIQTAQVQPQAPTGGLLNYGAPQQPQGLLASPAAPQGGGGGVLPAMESQAPKFNSDPIQFQLTKYQQAKRAAQRGRG
jgi:hypothetical protein